MCMNEEAKKGAGLVAIGALAVPKPWDECTVEEKLEIVRTELRKTRYTTTRVIELEREIERLRKHSHVDGKVVVPFEKNNELHGGDMTSDRLR